MSRLLIAVLLIFSFSGLNAATIAFEKSGVISVARPDGSKIRKVIKGVYPQISPDGSTIVFNTEDEKTTNRKIALADVATGKVTIIPNIPSDNCFDPVWAPNGEDIAFQMMRGTTWEIGLIKADGTEFRALPVQLPKGEEAWQPVWAADGKSLFCHDLYTVFQIALDGSVLKKWPLSILGKDVGMSSGSGMAVSPDGKYLLMDADMPTSTSIKDWDGPPPALWTLEIQSGKVSLASPIDLVAWSPYFLTDETVLCVGVTGSKPKPGLYQLQLKTGEYKLLIPGAGSPSASRN